MPEGPNWPPAKGWWADIPDHLGRAMFSLLGARCISSWEALRKHLGDPQSILCLGNGPSSESPVVQDVRCDCLFRVNWIWSGRVRNANPDVVFTADSDPPPAGRTPTICFPTRQDATRVLASYVALGNRMPVAYLVFPELPTDLAMKTWSYRPTNGALMVAAAVLLRPKRVIIAGVDLYRHPGGKYPGVAAGPNDYDPIHDRALDLSFMIAALSRFDGNIDILSPQLLAELEGRLRLNGIAEFSAETLLLPGGRQT